MSSTEHAYSTSGDERSFDWGRPFRVLGVALVVDQRGSGSKLVARYPTQPSTNPLSKISNDAATKQGTAQMKTTNTDNDLFFTLTARQMAKLFRTKKSLCGNPMTLSINGTIFCCRAVMMQDDGHEETHSGNDTASDSLVLFSVIVAMSVSHTTVKPPTDRSFDPSIEDISGYEPTVTSHTTMDPEHRKATNGVGHFSQEFLSIRRVHISLARYCRVLEREERRCHYVSLQANQFTRIRNEHRKKWAAKKASSGAISSGGKNVPSGNSSTASGMASKSVPTPGDLRGRNNRGSSSVTGPVGDDLQVHARQYDLTIAEEQEREQEILEMMLAASPPDTTTDIPKHYGNLARELVQVFHSLSRNDHILSTTPASMLIEREGVIYVNQHIAVPVEAAGTKASVDLDRSIVRPYYTLLFPHASPTEILHALQSSGSAPPQHIQQLLLAITPYVANGFVPSNTWGMCQVADCLPTISLDL